MITVIRGLTGSGKTWLQTRLIRKEWKLGAGVHVNYPVKFSDKNENIKRWHNLDELYNISNGIIGIDEGQKLFDSHQWFNLPKGFADKIAQHRKHHVDIFTTTQDFANIDVIVRRNVHELYTCQSILRFPKKDRVKPIIQVIRITKQIRQLTSNVERIQWKYVSRGKLYFISRFWTKEFYNTFADVGMTKFICSIKYQKKPNEKTGKWFGKIYSRNLVNRGKARL